MYYVYVLKSKITNFLYKGFCEDLDIRLHQHNTGMTKSNKAYIPFEIAYYEIDPYNVGAQGPVRKYVFYQTDDTSKGGWSHLRYLANEYIQAKYANDVDQYMTKRGLTEYDFRGIVSGGNSQMFNTKFKTFVIKEKLSI